MIGDVFGRGRGALTIMTRLLSSAEVVFFVGLDRLPRVPAMGVTIMTGFLEFGRNLWKTPRPGLYSVVKHRWAEFARSRRRWRSGRQTLGGNM